MDALGTKIDLDLKNCRKKLKKFEDAEKIRKEREAAFNKWIGDYSKKKPGKMGADAVLRDILSNKQPLDEAVAAAAAAPANNGGESKNGGRRRKTKKRRRKRKTKRKKRKTKKRRRKRKRKTKKKRRR